MQFRILNDTELQYFDEDFKHFLIINGVSNEEWVALNQENKKKAIELVALFSDTILQRVYEKVNYLECRSKNQLFVFKCDKEQIHLIHLNASQDEVDFSTPELIHQSLLNHSNKITFMTQSKNYSIKRELELFKMVEKGCVISTEEFYTSIEKTIVHE